MAVLTVTRTGETNQPVSVDYSTVDGTARAGQNYGSQSGTVFFEPGQVEKNIALSIEDDGLVTGDQTFAITLNNPIGGILGTFTNALMTVRDSEKPTVIDPTFKAFAGPPIGLTTDGKIVAVQAQADDSWIQRFNADGSPDTTFPEVRLDLYLYNDYALATNGQIYVAGRAQSPDPANPGAGAMKLLRYNANGLLDASFTPTVAFVGDCNYCGNFYRISPLAWISTPPFSLTKADV